MRLLLCKGYLSIAMSVAEQEAKTDKGQISSPSNSDSFLMSVIQERLFALEVSLLLSQMQGHSHLSCKQQQQKSPVLLTSCWKIGKLRWGKSPEVSTEDQSLLYPRLKLFVAVLAVCESPKGLWDVSHVLCNINSGCINERMNIYLVDNSGSH